MTVRQVYYRRTETVQSKISKVVSYRACMAWHQEGDDSSLGICARVKRLV